MFSLILCSPAQATFDIGATVRLDDNRVGKIIGEAHGSQLKVEIVPPGGGTQTVTIDKSKLRLLTDQERLEHAYQNTKRYDLDVKQSYPVGHYDKVVSEVLEPFLREFVASPYEMEIQSKIVDWKAERNRVAQGMGKYQGQWLPASEVRRLVVRHRLEHAFGDSRKLITEGKFDAALRKLESVVSASADEDLPKYASDLIMEIRQLHSELEWRWVDSLGQRSERIKDSFPVLESRIDRARERMSIAEKQLQIARDRKRQERWLGDEAMIDQLTRSFHEARNAYHAAVDELSRRQLEFAELQREIPRIRARIQTLETLLLKRTRIEVREHKGALSKHSPPNGKEKTAHPPILSAIVDWARTQWPLVAAFVLLLLWLFSRMTR